MIAEISAETGLPADDPVRFGGGSLWNAIRESVDALPWIQRTDGVGGAHAADDAAPTPRQTGQTSGS